MSKGSARRNEDIKKVWDNWDAIFGKKDQQEEQKPQEEPAKEEPCKDNAK